MPTDERFLKDVELTTTPPVERTLVDPTVADGAPPPSETQVIVVVVGI